MTTRANREMLYTPRAILHFVVFCRSRDLSSSYSSSPFFVVAAPALCRSLRASREGYVRPLRVARGYGRCVCVCVCSGIYSNLSFRRVE